ncbi:Lipase [Fusarium oxysporum f. sp. albedinis]|nr:Lipase [Fusarium oxysporum f. sp. albedinis]
MNFNIILVFLTVRPARVRATGNSSASEFEPSFSSTPPTSITFSTASVSTVAWFGSETVPSATRASAGVMNFLLRFGIAFFLPLHNRPTSSSKLATLALSDTIFDSCASNPFDITEYRLLIEGFLFFPRSLI